MGVVIKVDQDDISWWSKIGPEEERQIVAERDEPTLPEPPLILGRIAGGVTPFAQTQT
jgi:hypothetical protein